MKMLVEGGYFYSMRDRVPICVEHQGSDHFVSAAGKAAGAVSSAVAKAMKATGQW